MSSHFNSFSFKANSDSNSASYQSDMGLSPPLLLSVLQHIFYFVYVFKTLSVSQAHPYQFPQCIWSSVTTAACNHSDFLQLFSWKMTLAVSTPKCHGSSWRWQIRKCFKGIVNPEINISSLTSFSFYPCIKFILSYVILGSTRDVRQNVQAVHFHTLKSGWWIILWSTKRHIGPFWSLEI